MYSAIDTIWVLLGAALVFFMQAGFAMVETGFTRAKNAGNIVLKNLMDFAIGSVVFYIIGFGLMFGDSAGGIIGKPDLFIRNDYSASYPSAAFVIFQMVFCGTSATIASGAMAERTKFFSYVIYSAIISAFIYPLTGHWVWNDGGWLAQMGFHDFAGGTAVHLVGGMAALAGAKALGARIGKYTADGKSMAIPGHSLTLGCLGIFILWLSWFGFNGGSTMSMTGDENLVKASSIFLNTNLSAAAAAVTGMFITKVRYGKADISMILNSTLAGLVAITAGCDQVAPISAIVIGVCAAFTMLYGIEFIDHVLKIDDPVGASGVHGFCGALGTILTGVLSTEKGVLYTGKWDFFGVQCLGVLSVGITAFVLMSLIFFCIKKTVGLRVGEKEEVEGLDLGEHGIRSSYADFAAAGSLYSALPSSAEKLREIDLSAENFAKEYPDLAVPDGKIRNVVVITNPARLEMLKDALDKIDITGMTVSYVNGCGIQKGSTTLYRSSQMNMQLLPKVKVEIVISTVPVELLVKTVKDVLYTGNVGDGKIFIYEVERVIKVRTGQEGIDALE